MQILVLLQKILVPVLFPQFVKGFADAYTGEPAPKFFYVLLWLEGVVLEYGVVHHLFRVTTVACNAQGSEIERSGILAVYLLYVG